MPPAFPPRRRARDAWTYALAAGALLAWSAHLLRSTFVSAAFAALGGLAAAFLALAGPASAPCPACGAMLHGLFVHARTPQRCPHCRVYFQPKTMSPLPLDHVADSPLFAVPVGRGQKLPELCCSCAAPAVKHEELVFGRAASVRLGELRVEAPFCARHRGQARLRAMDLAPDAPPGARAPRADFQTVLLTRSYAFYRAALGLN